MALRGAVRRSIQFSAGAVYSVIRSRANDSAAFGFISSRMSYGSWRYMVARGGAESIVHNAISCRALPRDDSETIDTLELCTQITTSKRILTRFALIEYATH